MINWTSPLFLIAGITGIFLFLVAWFFKKFPPKKINSLYGYRTNRSMFSKEAWDFAQAYSAKAMLNTSLWCALFGCLGLFFSVTPQIDSVIALLSVLFSAIFPIVITEKQLKRKFKNEEKSNR